jgi:hypothetical protein
MTDNMLDSCLFHKVKFTFLQNSGHLAIPYYIKQKEEKLRKESEQMRIKCQSYIESGYYSDPRYMKPLKSPPCTYIIIDKYNSRCEELYLQTFSGYSSGLGLVPSSFSLSCILTLAIGYARWGI